MYVFTVSAQSNGPSLSTMHPVPTDIKLDNHTHTHRCVLAMSLATEINITDTTIVAIIHEVLNWSVRLFSAHN